MAISIPESDFDDALDAIGAAQPVPTTSRTAVARAILRKIVDRYGATGDADLTWLDAAPAPPSNGAAKSIEPSTFRDDPIDHGRHDAAVSDVDASMRSEKQLPPPAEADEGISKNRHRATKGERCQG